MIVALIRWFLGSSLFVCAENELTGVLDALMREEIPYDAMYRDAEERGHFRVYRSDRDRVRAVCGEFLNLRVEREQGLPHLIGRYRRRVGIPIGCAVFAWLIWLSSNVIWSMDVSGNETVSDTAIKEQLARLGCGIGSYIPDLDLWQVCNRYLLASDDLAFISVNLEGTVAHVEVMERHNKAESDWEAPNDATPSNLVATRAGQIIRYEVSSGQAVVRVHDMVKEGDVLVSGMVNTKVNPDNTYRLERAVGRVYAQTVHEFSVTVPLKTAETVTESKEMLEKRVNFFGWGIKVFKKGGKTPSGYAIITEKAQWVLFRSFPWIKPIALPIFTETVYGVRTREQSVTLSEAEAKKQAGDALWEQFAELMQDKEVLGYDLQEGMNERGDAYVISVSVSCIENIACEVPLSLTDIGEQENTN